MRKSRFSSRVALVRLGFALASAGLALALPSGAAAQDVACTDGVGDATALVSAVAAVAASGGTVDLSPNCTYTFTAGDTNVGDGPDALPIINEAVTIDGNGSAIERASSSPGFRFFEVDNGVLTLNDVTLEGGANDSIDDPGDGAGAILDLSGSDPNLVLNSSAFIDNSAVEGGTGAIYDSYGGGNPVVVRDSTFSGNSGGHGVITAWEASITNSTFVDNTSVYGALISLDLPWTIEGSTFVGNVATGSGEPAAFNGLGGTVTGSIFADGSGALECENSYGSLSLKYDLFESATPTTTSTGQYECSTDSTDELGVSTSALGLGPLQDNGGPVPTVGITPGSAAYHFVPAADCPATDARGVARPQPAGAANCDAGAFEFLGATITWPTPPAIQYGTPLTTAQLDASVTDMSGASLPGTFAYTPAAGTVLNPGQDQLSVSFTPSGNPLYGTTSATVPITVNKATTSLAATPASQASGSIAFSATLRRTFDGAAVAGATIVFSVGGQQVCQADTSSSGVASCTATGVALGPASYSATYAGDSDYLASAATGGLRSASFSVVSEKISKTGDVALGVQTHSQGALRGTATFTEKIKRTTGKGKHRKTHTTHKTIFYGSASATSNGTAIANLMIKPTKNAAKLLKQLKTLHLSITLSFTPTGGTLNELVMDATVKAPRVKKHKH